MKQIKFLFVTIAFLLFVSAIPEKTTTIQILGGECDKPQLPKKSKIKFILRQNASWK